MKRLTVASQYSPSCCGQTARRGPGRIREQISGELRPVVYPTGQFPADVKNVQARGNLGGAVLLKARNAANVFTPLISASR